MKFFILFALFFSSLHAKKTICLNMIVRDESKVIKRSLNSVKRLIDYWVIVDTGSFDNTCEIIKKTYHDIPGEIHHRKWVNFAHNRNEALELAKDKADYIFVLDADDEILYDQDFTLPDLKLDSYCILSNNGGTLYHRPHLIKANLDWKWIGVLYEGLISSHKTSKELLKGIVNHISYDGCRSQDPKKFEKDIVILKEAIEKEPLNTRYMFYLAQSYRDAGQLEDALRWYEKRAQSKGSTDEIFWSLSEAAKIKDRLERPEKEVVNAYLKAHAFAPNRIEPLFYLGRHYNLKQMPLVGKIVLEKAKKLPNPKYFVFFEKWIQEFGLTEALAHSHFQLGEKDEGLFLLNQLLEKPDLDKETIERLNTNITNILSAP